jgi:arylsulfatase A-like enzyme
MKYLFVLSVFVSGILFCSGKPNVVVFLSDDQGWGDFSMHGNTNLSTPNIDQMASEGASFESFNVCPVCSPTRAEFLTGRYHARGGVYSTSAGGERLDLDETTIAETFKAAGYATGAFGKWHNGMQAPYHPNSRGFDEFYGFCSGHWGNYFDPLLERNGELVRGKGFCIDDFTNQAMDFIGKSVKAGKPFFAYLPYNTPHSPMQVPEEFWMKHKDNPLEMKNVYPQKMNHNHTRAAMAMCENIDWNVGRLLGRLDNLGIRQDTIVLYFNDNGPNGVRWNGGMKGRKGSTDEGGVRSPLVVRWPGKVCAGKKISQIAGAIDLHPTLASLCGIPLAKGNPLDGKDLSSLLLEGKGADGLEGRKIFSKWRDQASVRTQRFRMDNAYMLYELASDPGQEKDVSKQYPELANSLAKELERWKEEMKRELDQGNRPFPLGHPDSKFTQVPARDAKAHGGIKRSNKFPNCSYFGNWKDKDADYLTWDVWVEEAGEYGVELWYACREKGVGTRMELTLGSGKVVATVTKANPVSDKGMEHDRVPRQESYVKDFVPLDMGVIRLEKGPGELRLGALEIPGEEGIEFRLLMFTKK